MTTGQGLPAATGRGKARIPPLGPLAGVGLPASGLQPGDTEVGFLASRTASEQTGGGSHHQACCNPLEQQWENTAPSGRVFFLKTPEGCILLHARPEDALHLEQRRRSRSLSHFAL